jgi:hypothetical protein
MTIDEDAIELAISAYWEKHPDPHGQYSQRECMIRAIEAYEQAKKPDTALVQKLVDALNDSGQLLQDAQDIMRANIIPDGISNKDAIAAYIALLDNTRQRKVQTQTHKALTEAEAWLEERR